nr:N-acetylneuraminate synthase family protein [Pistricoccus aurantiacus]
MSGYSAPAEDYNLRTIPDMIARFGLVSGLSGRSTHTTAITSTTSRN